MKHVRTPLVFVLMLLLPAAAVAAQEKAAEKPLDAARGSEPVEGPGVVIPEDGLFRMPNEDDVGWFHTYINLWWLVPMIATAVLLLWTAKWIDGDAHKVAIDPVKWNYVTIVVCLASLAAFLTVPPWISLPGSLLVMLLVVRQYIPLRNRRVLPSRRLFTPEHRMLMWRRFLGVFGVKPKGIEQKLARVAKKYLPVTLFFQAGRMASPAEAPPDERDPATTAKEVVGRAIERHAREITVTPQRGNVAVSLAIDGLMYPETPLERLPGSGFVTLVKHLCDWNSADPHFRVELPTMHAVFTVHVRVLGEGDAESLWMRLCPDGERIRRLVELGLTASQGARVKKALDAGRGLVAVASPVGMGARTTLYAMLDSLDPYSRSIVTFERPVISHLASIEQNDMDRLGTPLAEVLKEKSRQDYHVTMLSEVPDRGSALLAVTAGQREQFFITRFELPDAVSVVRVLLKMGVEPKAVAAGLHTVVAQCLVRVLCTKCRSQVVPSAELLQKLHLDPSQVTHFWEETSGCDACGRTGFHGRTGIFEVWQPGEDSRRLIAAGADVQELRAAAHRDGMVGLQHSGLLQVIAGTTSLHELARVLKIQAEGN